MTNILDKIDLWHGGSGDVPLHEFLGMTWDEYKTWVETTIIPESLKDVYYEGR